MSLELAPRVRLIRRQVANRCEVRKTDTIVVYEVHRVAVLPHCPYVLGLADGNGLHGVERLSAVHNVKADVGVVKQRRTALNRHAMGRLWAPSPLAFLLLLVLFLSRMHRKVNWKSWTVQQTLTDNAGTKAHLNSQTRGQFTKVSTDAQRLRSE